MLTDLVDDWIQGEDAEQVRDIFGPIPNARVVALLGALLGHPVVACPYAHTSVGVTAELVLADGSRCILKATRNRQGVRGALEVQRHLASRGFPAPALLQGPVHVGNAIAWLGEVADRGEVVRYSPKLRRVMASTFAHLVTEAEGLPVRDLRNDRPRGKLWLLPRRCRNAWVYPCLPRRSRPALGPH